LLQGVSEKKTAQSFACDKFCTIRHRIALIPPKCSAKIIFDYKSSQNLCKLIKHSLLNSQKCSHIISDITCSALTVEERLLIKTLQIEKGWTVDRMIVEFQVIQYILGPTIWDALQHMAYRQKIMNIDHLKQVLNSGT